MKLIKLIAAAAAIAFFGLPSVTVADSDLQLGGVGTSASARLDFQIVIPDFVFFQVGTLGNGNIDRVDFDLNAAGLQPGAGGPAMSANGGVGDGADGILTVNLATNATNVNMEAVITTDINTGPNTPAFTDILVAAGGTIPHPGFGAGPVAFAPGGFSLTDTWTYTYDNSNVYTAGTYTGRITYTVTTL